METDRRRTYRRITTDAGHCMAMCARTLDDSFDNGDHASSWSDTRQTGNDVTSSCMTSSAEFPASLSLRRRRRLRGIPSAWRYSLPSTITASAAASRHVPGAVPTAASISGGDGEPISGVGRRRPLCRYIATGSRNATESEPRVRPTCLRYSYWLTLDVAAAGEFSGGEHHLRRHFRLRSSEINNDGREPASCRFTSPRNGELATNSDDDESVLRRHLSFCHVTGSRASQQVISPSSTDVVTRHRDDATHSANGASRTVRLNPDDGHEERIDNRPLSGSDVIEDRSGDEVEGQRRLSLSKIGDSGLGTSIHSEQASPDEAVVTDHHHHHHHCQHQQQEQQQRRLSDNDEPRDVSKCQRQRLTQREGDDHLQRYLRDDIADDRTKLTRHKREYARLL